MKFVETPKYFNQYLVSCSGYYGDMDEFVHDVKVFEKDEEKEALNYAVAYSLMMTHEEDFESLPLSKVIAKLKKLGLEVGEDSIPYSWDFDTIPTIEEVEVLFFDENGLGHTLTVES